MAVVIRMKRTGRRNRPCYRITVADSRSPRDGKFIENLGLYDPVSPNTEAQVTLDVERAKHWLSQGATPSDTVRSILKKNGALEGLPEPKRRKRTGRRKVTAKRTKRLERKAATLANKETRRNARVEAKRAAAAAAKAAEGEGEE